MASCSTCRWHLKFSCPCVKNHCKFKQPHYPHGQDCPKYQPAKH